MTQYVERAGSGAATVTGRIYLLLFPIPVVCFLAALATDVTYAGTAYLMWLHFSEWLIAAGLLFGALAALALLVEFFASASIRRGWPGWTHLVVFYAALIVELCNSFNHTIDGWTAVVPTGMILSIVGSILAVAAAATLFVVPVAWVRYQESRA